MHIMNEYNARSSRRVRCVRPVAVAVVVLCRRPLSSPSCPSRRLRRVSSVHPSRRRRPTSVRPSRRHRRPSSVRTSHRPSVVNYYLHDVA